MLKLIFILIFTIPQTIFAQEIPIIEASDPSPLVKEKPSVEDQIKFLENRVQILESYQTELDNEKRSIHNTQIELSVKAQSLLKKKENATSFSRTQFLLNHTIHVDEDWKAYANIKFNYESLLSNEHQHVDSKSWSPYISQVFIDDLVMEHSGLIGSVRIGHMYTPFGEANAKQNPSQLISVSPPLPLSTKTFYQKFTGLSLKGVFGESATFEIYTGSTNTNNTPMLWGGQMLYGFPWGHDQRLGLSFQQGLRSGEQAYYTAGNINLYLDFGAFSFEGESLFATKDHFSYYTLIAYKHDKASYYYRNSFADENKKSISEKEKIKNSFGINYSQNSNTKIKFEVSNHSYTNKYDNDLKNKDYSELGFEFIFGF